MFMSVNCVIRDGRFFYMIDRVCRTKKPRRDRMSVASLLI